MRLLDSLFIKVPLWSIRKAFYLLFLAFLGSLLIGITVFILYMKSLPSLSTWHTTILQNEFTTKSSVKDFDAYIALEDQLFEELDSKIYDKVLPCEQNRINRYT